MKKIIFRFFILFVIFTASGVNIETKAQCPMCRMSAEADLKSGGTKAKGLNAGIMYMLGFPYILLGTLGFIWYRERRKIGEADQISELRALLEPHDWKS
jgi:hypothetical protein